MQYHALYIEGLAVDPLPGRASSSTHRVESRRQAWIRAHERESPMAVPPGLEQGRFADAGPRKVREGTSTRTDPAGSGGHLPVAWQYSPGCRSAIVPFHEFVADGPSDSQLCAMG